MSRWTAEVFRSDRSQVGLRRPGDGRPDSDPWADHGCLYIIGPDEARDLGRQLIAAADAVTPGEDPAPRGAGAPDAAGGASGVGLRSTIFECRVCDRVSNGYNDGSVAEPGWHDILNIDGPDAICPDCVTDPTALDSLRADGYDNARVGAARPVAGALGVGLTNCDSCALAPIRPTDCEYPRGAGWRAVVEWVNENTLASGAPRPGATGCPGWAKRGEG